MTLLKKPVELETAFNVYTLSEQLGEGGAGRVYGGVDTTGAEVAVKVLTNHSTDKRRRFKNEIGFLSRNRHANIVTVTDHGLSSTGAVRGPFYVMRRFAGNLRGVLERRLETDDAMALFVQIIDGVEAAHLQHVTHRDLKPENVLTNAAGDTVAVADFGVARFTEENLATLVETTVTTRLANFQYAAPEQRVPGRTVTAAADIYALGLMLNELFTGVVPHGTDYRSIATAAPDYAFLDPIVAAMIRQDPNERPASIAELKGLIQKHRAEAVSLQRISAIDAVVIPAGEVDDPLAHEPPKLVAAEFQDGTLRMQLDRPVNQNWVHALHNMGNFSAVMGVPPTAFQFNGADVTVNVSDHSVQSVIDYFKAWLPVATSVLRTRLRENAERAKQERIQQLQRERAAEERNLRINQSLRI